MLSHGFLVITRLSTFLDQGHGLLPPIDDMLSTSWFKVFTFLGVWAAVWLPIALLVLRFIDWQPREPLIPKQKLILLASLYIIVPGIVKWKINIESLSWVELGLYPISHILWYLLWGLILSLGSLIIVFSVESIFNLVNWQWQNLKQIIPLTIPIFCLSLLISLIEELVFRGYVLSTLLVDNSLLIAALASSLIFAFLHLIWERSQTMPQIPGLWIMGIVLVAARIVGDQSLYLAVGLHTGWIWGLTCIDSAELVTYKHQSHWFTGINQQPLAGVAGILCLVLTSLTIFGLMFSNLL